MKQLATSLEANFGGRAEGADSLALHIEGDPGFYEGADLHLRLIPGVDATVRVSDGSIRKGSVRPMTINAGIAQFSGSDSASLPYPPIFSYPSVDAIFAFDLNGNPTSVGFHYESGEIKASKPCYAAVRYGKYVSSYLELIYSPLLESLGSGGVKVTTGAIAAFYPPNSITVFQPDPVSVEEGNAEFELYRIISTAVTTTEGKFETPPNFPADGTYPDSALVIDTEVALQSERVHEIGFMDGSGRGWIRTYYVPIYEPYSTNLAYHPEKVCRMSSIPSGLSSALILRAKNFVRSRGYGAICTL